MSQLNRQNPDAIRFYQNSLLPQLVQVPKESQFDKNLIKDIGQGIGNWLQTQAAQNLAVVAATGKPLSHWILKGGNNLLNAQPVVNGVAAFGATQLGRPILNSIKNFADSPAGKKVGDYAKIGLDWIF